MARCGVDSRRKCEELISEGRVEINGEIVRELGVKIDPMRDRIKVDGKALRTEKPVYYIHYKVKGVTTTVADDLGRKTVMHCLPDIRERVYPVGRLDKDTEGLLVFTNDGELANYLTQPAHGVEKTYRVVAEGRIGEDVVQTLAEKGMRLGPVLVKPSRVKLIRYDNDNSVIEITVTEGIHREVRRIFAALGHEVKKLLRIQQGPLTLDGLKRGATRALTPREIQMLQKSMAEINPEMELTLFPAGSAASRRPTGPRGRPRRTKAPRMGKPDPALSAKPARPSAKSSRGGKPSRPSRKNEGKGKIVVDDWKKGEAKKRRSPSPVSEKPTRPLRPMKSRTGARTEETARPSPRPARASSAKPAKVIRHPLASKPPSSPAKRGKPGKRK